jgi:prepilin peptidase CpaA
MTIAHVVVVLVAAVGCAIDLRTRRIPNVLTFGAAGGALVFALATRGLSGGIESLVGFLVGAALMLVPFALGGMGAGDVKLLGALGAWLGPADAIWLFLYTGISGGVIALVVAVFTGYLGQACRNILRLLEYWRAVGLRPMVELTLHSGRGPRLAYGAAIFAGTVATIWLR